VPTCLWVALEEQPPPLASLSYEPLALWPRLSIMCTLMFIIAWSCGLHFSRYHMVNSCFTVHHLCTSSYDLLGMIKCSDEVSSLYLIYSWILIILLLVCSLAIKCKNYLMHICLTIASISEDIILVIVLATLFNYKANASSNRSRIANISATKLCCCIRI
jgi:small-conductance mechanosensitive channel